MKNTLKITTPSDTTLLVTRDFDAPRQIVWDAMAKPEFLKRWLFGPPGWEMTVCEDDRRVGGSFHWQWKGPEGVGMSMRGVNKEIVPPTKDGKGGRAVRTESFETGCMPQMGEQLCTMQLAEVAGSNGQKTRLLLTVEYPSKQARDGAVASGMEHGMAAGYDRLEEMLLQGAF